MALVFEPFAEAELVFGGSKEPGDLAGVFTTLEMS